MRSRYSQTLSPGLTNAPRMPRTLVPKASVTVVSSAEDPCPAPVIIGRRLSFLIIPTCHSTKASCSSSASKAACSSRSLEHLGQWRRLQFGASALASFARLQLLGQRLDGLLNHRGDLLIDVRHLNLLVFRVIVSPVIE